MVSVVIHSNPNLANQRETAGWLQAGFKRHGIAAAITADKHTAADVHVIQGPWYAYEEWKPNSATHRVLWLNRCFYGHSRFDLSLGWLRPDGTRDFRNDGVTAGKGKLPELQPRKGAGRCAVIFADYGQADIAERVLELRQTWIGSLYFRPHPQQRGVEVKAITLRCPLEHVWSLCDTAFGHSSTVLVDAEINGLQVNTGDPAHVVHHPDVSRETWLARLSWAQWNHSELMNGDFWSHLQ